MYKHASPLLLDGFQSYLFMERESRFKRRKLIEKIEDGIDILFSEKNEASCYKFLSFPMRTRQTHINLVSKGIGKLEKMNELIIEDERILQEKHSSIFVKNKLKSWAKEQNEYNKTSLQRRGELKDTISEKLEQLC